jgi:hypothetical protein
MWLWLPFPLRTGIASLTLSCFIVWNLTKILYIWLEENISYYKSDLYQIIFRNIRCHKSDLYIILL